MRQTIVTAAAAIALAGCATTGMSLADVVGSGSMATATGESRGTVNLTRSGDDIRMLVQVVDMMPGTYGTHLHAVGRCEAPGFTSAGPHWNPTSRQHGRLNPAGTHHGDLPNIVVGADGRGRLDVPLIGNLDGVDGLFDADGAALVVHARADDERTDPTGNSGDRIVCAVLTAV